MSLWSDFLSSEIQEQKFDNKTCTEVLIKECKKHNLNQEGWQMIEGRLHFLNEKMNHFCHQW